MSAPNVCCFIRLETIPLAFFGFRKITDIRLLANGQWCN